MKKDIRVIEGWYKELSKKTLDTIKKIDPEEVVCIVQKQKYIFFKFKKDNTWYQGVAICSILDKFDETIGKNKAAGRAIRAYIKSTSKPIRKQLSDFPGGWTLSQAWNVIWCPATYKSEVFKIPVLSE